MRRGFGVGVIGGERDKIGRGLQIDVGRFQSSIGQFFPQLGRRLADIAILPRRLQMRPALEQAEVDAVESESGDQVEGVVMREEREGEVGAGELELHGGSINAVWPFVSHSAAAR